jgi:hypothetical protein
MTTPLPQRHCKDTTDHPAHRHGLGGQYGYAWCPGRVTCRSITSEKYGEPAHPMDTDPFAGTDSIWD